MVTHHRLQPIRHLAEKRVTDRVAQRIIDVLEPVEVDQEQGAAFAPVGGVAQRLIQRLAHQGAIGQAGKGVEPGKPADFLFRPSLFGEVRSDPAKAQEPTAVVENRIA